MQYGDRLENVKLFHALRNNLTTATIAFTTFCNTLKEKGCTHPDVERRADKVFCCICGTIMLDRPSRKFDVVLPNERRQQMAARRKEKKDACKALSQLPQDQG